MKKTVVIAAAGKGKRLGQGLPKCLVKIKGQAIFEYQLKAFSEFDEIRMVVGYQAEEVMNTVSSVRNDVVFIRNDNYENTTTLQSMYLGAKGLKGKVLFLDGDMVLGKKTIRDIESAIKKEQEFIAVSCGLSEEPVYAGVLDNLVIWFDYNRSSVYEWANLAYIDCSKLAYNKTHFFVQLEKFLPIPALEIERLEIDTPADFELAQRCMKEEPEKFG